MDEVTFDSEFAARLAAFGFDKKTFDALRERWRRTGGAWDNALAGKVEPPRPGEVTDFPPPESEERQALARRGLEALAAGRVGVVVLAGGMATRFGGAVKAACEVLPGRTFLDIKVADVAAIARRVGRPVPTFLMASFATSEAIQEMAARASRPDVPIETFTQFVSLRLTPEGDIFRDDDGRPSLYAPGHGDLPFALRASGVLARFMSGGGQLLFVSNVDNVAATLDPAVIGAHLASGQAVTVEVAPKEPGDRGGAPARVDGKLQVVETFRFPPSFDQELIPVFNTNTFVLDAASLDRDFALTWFAVHKDLGGRQAIQFERLLGELTTFLPSMFLRVEREGPDGRFQPVKEVDDLERRRPAIARIIEARLRL